MGFNGWDASSDVVWLADAERTRRGCRTDAKTVDLAGAVVDLAGKGPWEAASPKRSSSSRIVHVDAAGDASTRPGEGEIGTLYDRDRLFAFYEQGKTFQDPTYTVSDIETMIATDGKGSALEQALILPLRSAEWRLEGAKGDRGEMEMVQQTLMGTPTEGGMKTPMNSVIASMASASMFRRSHFELCWEVRDSKPGGGKGLWLNKIAYRMPSTCYLARYAATGEFAGFMQWTWKDDKFQRMMIPANKAFVFLHGQHRNPLEGISDLSLAYQVYVTKQKLRFLWLSYLEDVSLPRAKAKHYSKDGTEALAFAKDVANLRRGGVIALKEGQEVEPYSSPRGGESEFTEAMNFLESEQSGSILAGFLDLTGGAARLGRGSMALSQDQSRFFLQMRQGVLTEMETGFTFGSPDGVPGVINQIAKWNYGVDAKPPKLIFGSLLQTDAVDKTVALLQAVASAPQVNLPSKFIDFLIEKTANYLGMNPDAVAEALKEEPMKDILAKNSKLQSMMGGQPLQGAPPAPGQSATLAKARAAIGRAHQLTTAAQGGNGNGNGQRRAA